MDQIEMGENNLLEIFERLHSGIDLRGLSISDEYGVKFLNIFYDMGSGIIFCLLDAPDSDSIEKHHYKFGVKCVVG
jgi:hypothetical protein